MIKHKKELESYPQGSEKLATELGDLRYDALAEFLKHLAEKLNKDSIADGQRNRNKLSKELATASELIHQASKHMDNAWVICEPFMETYEA